VALFICNVDRGVPAAASNTCGSAGSCVIDIICGGTGGSEHSGARGTLAIFLLS
jgi:hypothetical protein